MPNERRGFCFTMRYTDKIRGNDGKIRKIGTDEFVPRNDLRGKRFGRLLVLDFDHKGGKQGRTYYYRCLCDCGKEVIKPSTYLLHSNINPHQSCGCWHKELYIAASTTHGHGNRYNPTYKTWNEMKYRCENPNSDAYKHYGGRGIKVCARWRDSFENFLADMGERPSKYHSIDRIDVNGDYCPENCRWATTYVQCNNRRNNIYVTYNRKTKTLKQWCDDLGMNYNNVRAVYSRGKRSFEFIVAKYSNRGNTSN